MSGGLRMSHAIRCQHYANFRSTSPAFWPTIKRTGSSRRMKSSKKIAGTGIRNMKWIHAILLGVILTGYSHGVSQAQMLIIFRKGSGITGTSVHDFKGVLIRKSAFDTLGSGSSRKLKCYRETSTPLRSDRRPFPPRILWSHTIAPYDVRS